MEEYESKIRSILIIFYIILGIGSIVGSLYYVNCNDLSGNIKNSLDSYINSIKNGVDIHNVTINILKNNLILLAVLFIAAFFKIGIAIFGLIIIKKGFVTGFTVASIIDIYNFRGAVILLSSILQYLVVIPLILLIMSINSVFSLKLMQFDKKNFIFFILFLIFSITIFCIEAVCEGFFSTTFMKWVMNLVT